MNARHELAALIAGWLASGEAPSDGYGQLDEEQLAAYLAGRFHQVNIEVEERSVGAFGRGVEWEAHLRIDHTVGPVRIDNHRSVG